MLRATLLCLIAIAVTPALTQDDFDDVDEGVRVTRNVTYRETLRTVAQASELVKSHLVNDSLRLTDPQFHRALVLGVVGKAASRLSEILDNSRHALPVYVETLNEDLPFVFSSPATASAALAKSLATVESTLLPLVDLVNEVCQGLDDKDCNKVVEITVDEGNADPLVTLRREKAVRVLVLARLAAKALLRDNENILLAAQKLSGLGYVLKNRNKLSNMALLLSRAVQLARAYTD